MNKQTKLQYIILPGKTHKSVHVPNLMYSYSDLLVAKQTELKGKNREEALFTLLKEGDDCLINRQLVDFLKLLKSGKAYDGNGKRINEKELLSIYDKMTKAVSPFRAEWLGDSYIKINSGLYRGYNNCLVNKKVIATTFEKLEDYVTGNCFVDLNSFNYQGLPTRRSEKQEYEQGKNVYYWPPRDGFVVVFGAGSVWAFLGCGGDPTDTDAGLGVRRAKNFKG